MNTPAPSAKAGIEALRRQIDAPVAAFFSSCVHCGLCAEVCAYYVTTQDPAYTPVRKLELLRRVWRDEFTVMGKVGRVLGLTKPLNDTDFTAWETLVYDSCTLCGRCSLACPVGNDLTYMLRKTREGMSAAGHAPVELSQAAGRHLELGSPMGNLRPALDAQLKHARAETGLDITVDQPGVDYMAIYSAQEVAEFPGVIAAMAKIFAKAGITWTISSQAFEASNVGVQIGDSQLARTVVARVVEAAEALNVKGVIAPECGHAYQALRWEGPNLLGRAYGFEVVHIIEVRDRLQAEGRWKTRGKSAERVTFHDPCQISRRGGIEAEPRRLLNAIADDFVETEDSGVWNWCCGGGGGVGANGRADALRKTAFAVKKDQLEKTKAATIVTMCAYCHHTLEGALEDNAMEVEVASLAELMADHLTD